MQACQPLLVLIFFVLLLLLPSLLLPSSSACRQNAEAAVGRPTLADGMHLEADFFELSVVQYTTTIEEECRLRHCVVELEVWVQFELVPLCQHGNRMCCLR